MTTALPTKTDLNGTPTTGVFKAAIGAVHDYLAGLAGSDGTPATALATMRLLDPKAAYNLNVVPTVGSNALTMTLKSRDASDLAAANPGFISQRDATIGNGLFNLRTITANIALTISAGSTLGHASGQPGWLYWYLIDNAGTQELAVSGRYFGESGIVSTTAEGGAGGADAADVMYSASARSNVPYRLINRTQDTQSVAGNWVNLPSRIDAPPFSNTDQRPGTMMMWPGMTAPTWALVRDGAAISRAVYAALFAAVCPLRDGSLTASSAAVTGLSSTRDLWVGMPVEGASVPAATTIASIDSASAITLSANATSTATEALTLFPYGYGSGGSSSTFGVPDDREYFERAWAATPTDDKTVLSGTTTSSSAVVTGLATTNGMYVGQALSGTGVPGSTTIASIDSATQITMSANATASAAVPLTFTGRSFGTTEDAAVDTGNAQFTVDTTRNVPSSGGTYDGFRTSQNGGTTGNTVLDYGAETRPRNRAYLPIIVY